VTFKSRDLYVAVGKGPSTPVHSRLSHYSNSLHGMPASDAHCQAVCSFWIEPVARSARRMVAVDSFRRRPCFSL
jgi:hypothetical protein